MRIKLVNRKYIIANKFFRFEKIIGIKLIGYKISIGIYEIRFFHK